MNPSRGASVEHRHELRYIANGEKFARFFTSIRTEALYHVHVGIADDIVTRIRQVYLCKILYEVSKHFIALCELSKN